MKGCMRYAIAVIISVLVGGLFQSILPKSVLEQIDKSKFLIIIACIVIIGIGFGIAEAILSFFSKSPTKNK